MSSSLIPGTKEDKDGSFEPFFDGMAEESGLKMCVPIQQGQVCQVSEMRLIVKNSSP